MDIITREIGIDMGHRVPNHKSKCKNMHGHRYPIQLSVTGTINDKDGDSEQGMVKDFGFLKDVMMKEINDISDHHLHLWINDPLAGEILPKTQDPWDNDPLGEKSPLDRFFKLQKAVTMEYEQGFFGDFGIINWLSFIPTAENLAKWWGLRCQLAMKNMPEAEGVKVVQMKVWETPNCSAVWWPNDKLVEVNNA